MIRKKLGIAAVVSALGALAGCANLAPDFVRPAAPVAESWPETGRNVVGEGRALAEIGWQDFFTEPRLKQLVEDMLVLARADENGMTTRIQSVDLDDVVRAEVTRMRALAPATVSSEIVPARVDGDPGQLTRAIRNIADNAARHTRNELSLRMSRDDRERTVAVTIADDGDGFAPDILQRIGEPYVTRRQKDDSAGGLGLGLFIAKTLLERSGARLRFENGGPDRPGARVSVEWPRALMDTKLAK